MKPEEAEMILEEVIDDRLAHKLKKVSLEKGPHQVGKAVPQPKKQARQKKSQKKAVKNKPKNKRKGKVLSYPCFNPNIFSRLKQDDKKKKYLIKTLPKSSLNKLLNIKNMDYHIVGDVPSPPSNILGLGAKFIPSRHVSTRMKSQSMFDMFDFERRTNIRLHFDSNSLLANSETSTNEKDDQFNPKFHIANPTWEPPNCDPDIQCALETLEKHVREEFQRFSQAKFNTPKEDWLEMKRYLLENDVVIRQADKNLGLCVVDTKWYQDEALRQLSSKTYTHLTEASTNKLVIEMRNKLITLMNERGTLLPVQEKKFICQRLNNEFSFPNWYHIPKVHKTMEGKPITGRPITPAHSFITSNASKWLAHKLQPFVEKQDYILKDSTDFIRKIEGLEIDKEDILFTVDVESLYPSIPHSYGVDAVKEIIPIDVGPMRDLIISILDIVNRSNIFKFNNQYYFQNFGTAMGYSHAPPYANIAMWKVESDYLPRSNHNTNLRVWLRFIDDVFAIWKGSLESLLDFFTYLNNILPWLRFTIKHGSQIAFLDTLVYGSTQGSKKILKVRTYQKELNKYLYIPFSSYHHDKAKTAWIKTELLRYVRTNTDFKHFCDMRSKFLSRLKERGYPVPLILGVMKEVKFADRQTLFEKTETSANLKPPVVFKTEYNAISRRSNLRRYLNEYHGQLKDKPNTQTLFGDRPPIIAYKKGPSLLTVTNAIERQKNNVESESSVNMSELAKKTNVRLKRVDKSKASKRKTVVVDKNQRSITSYNNFIQVRSQSQSSSNNALEKFREASKLRAEELKLARQVIAQRRKAWEEGSSSNSSSSNPQNNQRVPVNPQQQLGSLGNGKNASRRFG
jgi:hypothetical protein